MKSLFAIITLAAALGLTACAKKEPETAGKASDKPTEKASAKEPESRVSHGTNGEIFVTLDEAAQKAIDLKVAPLAAAESNEEVKGYGHVLDPSTLAAASADLITATAASATSQAELKRVQTLAAQNNASDKVLQAAQAAFARDQAQLDVTKLKLTAGWGRAIAERQDLSALIKSLSAQESVLVQVDVPLGTEPKEASATARLVTLSGQTLSAQFVGPASAVNPQFQGRGFIYLVSANAFGLAPGANLSAFLPVPGKAQAGALVPREAIVRSNGGAWMYVQREPEKFERLEVPLEKPWQNGFFAQGGLKAGDKVVTQGAQQLLSEELKGGGVD